MPRPVNGTGPERAQACRAAPPQVSSPGSWSFVRGSGNEMNWTKSTGQKSAIVKDMVGFGQPSRPHQLMDVMVAF